MASPRASLRALLEPQQSRARCCRERERETASLSLPKLGAQSPEKAPPACLQLAEVIALTE